MAGAFAAVVVALAEVDGLDEVDADLERATSQGTGDDDTASGARRTHESITCWRLKAKGHIQRLLHGRPLQTVRWQGA